MTTTTHRTRGTRLARRTALTAGLLAASLALSACAVEPPTPSPDAAVEGPTLTRDGYSNVLAEVNAALTAASEAKDPELLKSRVTGPALTVRTSQLQVAAKIGNTDLVTYLPAEYEQFMVSTQTEWPRTAFAITTPTDNLGPQRMLVLTQDSARAPYKLWGWVQLRPGITMPQFADIKLGSEILAPDDASLKISPQDVIGQYADVLTHGAESAFAGAFESGEEDPFRILIASLVTAHLAPGALDPNDPQIQGTYTWSFTPTPDTPVKAIRTADGGAVVFGALNGTETMGVVQGATIGPDGVTANALFGDLQRTNRVVSGFSDMVALFVPPAGSDQPVKLVGYSHVQTSIANAEPEAPAEG